jgi:Outer membrane protein Omp28/Secretion system C-terminal sorting domain
VIFQPIFQFSLLFLAFSAFVFAQNGVKKYVLIEHITNSKCSVCGSKNPTFYNLINQAAYASEVHHISIHPAFPYPSCVLYQANTSENAARTNFYPNVFGTPTVVLNGIVNPGGNELLTAAKLNSVVNQTSPLYLKVTETGDNLNRTVTVSATAFGAIPSGNYRIFAAVVEKKITLSPTPAGGANHYDVFRKMLPAIDGETFIPPAAGQTTNFTYTYNIPASWNPDEVYVVAFVQNLENNEVLNSGTKFDPVVSSAPEVDTETLSVFPNPVSEETWVDLGGAKSSEIAVFDANGKKILAEYEEKAGGLLLSTRELKAGIYWLRITGEGRIYTGRFVKI